MEMERRVQSEKLLTFKIYGEYENILDALKRLRQIYHFTTSAIKTSDKGGHFVFVDILEVLEE